MSLTAGIAGLPNVGKSTLFNALCSGGAAAENYPFCTIEPNRGIAAVPDDRLSRLTAVSPSQKAAPAFLELVDIAGLVTGASRGEGLGNQFLGHLRAADAIVHVVRCFDDPDVVHVDGDVDPVRDCATIETEMLYKDLETVERAREKAAKAAKSNNPRDRMRADMLERLGNALGEGTPARALRLSDPERLLLRELGLCTSKKTLYVANVDETGYSAGNPAADALESWAADRGETVVRICAQLEAEIRELPPAEREEFLRGMGLPAPALTTLAREIYSLLDLVTFFTVSEKENRAWPLRRGSPAPVAAGTVHSDFARGFICADVYRLEELEAYGREAALRGAGKIRQEGREYIVEDGDIMYFKGNV